MSFFVNPQSSMRSDPCFDSCWCT